MHHGLAKYTSNPILLILPLTASVRTRLPWVPRNSQTPLTGLTKAATNPPLEGQTDMKIDPKLFVLE